ncbi:MAG TPA: methionine adenosyltransferase [Thermoplasmata archaeon]|nr:methionine adenosyltransferase [Thermoplasmata archaeon]
MTARNIMLETIDETPIEKQNVEIVERKGIGHPDSVADGLSESVSRALCRMYLERYDRILHHNTDETQIVGGQSAPKFGGGAILEPIYILLVGRATTEVNGERLPYRTTALKAAYDYIKKNFKHLDPDWDVTLDCKIGQGSVDLRGLYETKKRLSNDTSFGVSFAPLSETERLVLETERYINGPLKKKLPEVGKDVKVMACREKGTINLTVAAAMVSPLIKDRNHYIGVVDDLKQAASDFAAKLCCRDVNVDVNTGDDYNKDIFYLTVSGLSMENGDDGSVGRGNRVNGLITPFRPMSMEASAGKNPVTHVGKIYNLLSYQIAQRIAEAGKGDIHEVRVRILAQIGKRIDMPQVASVQLIYADGVKPSKYAAEVRSIVDDHLENIDKITTQILKNELNVF